MTFLRRLFCAFCLSISPAVATADSHGTGGFVLMDETGATVLGLNLVEERGQFTGSGRTADADAVTVRHGTRLGDRLQLTLRFEPATPTGLPGTARLVVTNDATARLLYRGQITDGAWQPGDVTAMPEPAATSEPAAAPVPTPETVALPPACAELQALTTEAEEAGDQDALDLLAQLSTLYGLTDGTRSAAKCKGALDEFDATFASPEEDAEPPACIAVFATLEDIDAELAATGAAPSSQPEIIMTGAGMLTLTNPAGENTEDTCSAALAGLTDYRDGIGTKESGVAGLELPPGYRTEPVTNINLAGEWRIAGGGARMALWARGRSTVAYEIGPGARRTVWFWKPRKGLANIGVRRGTLFIEGQRLGDVFEGEARRFVEGCGAFVYPVSGQITENETEVRLEGLRPVVDAACDVTNVEPYEFRMSFQSDNPRGARNLNVEGAANASSLPDTGIWAQRYRVRSIDRGGFLNVRRSPSGSAAVLGRLPHNARNIRMLGAGCTPAIDQEAFAGWSTRQRTRALATRWCRVRWRDQRGWVYGRYLRPM